MVKKKIKHKAINPQNTAQKTLYQATQTSHKTRYLHCMSVIIQLQCGYQIYWGGRPGRDCLILEVVSGRGPSLVV